MLAKLVRLATADSDRSTKMVAMTKGPVTVPEFSVLISEDSQYTCFTKTANKVNLLRSYA